MAVEGPKREVTRSDAERLTVEVQGPKRLAIAEVSR
jgi:hypothetical protein